MVSRMARNVPRIPGTSRIILITLGIALWILASRNQINHGWFTTADIWLLATGTAAFATALLPGVVRVNLLLLITLLVILEVIFSILVTDRPDEKYIALAPDGTEVDYSTFSTRDQNLGFKLIADSQIISRHMHDDTTVFEMAATTDSLGRRTTQIIAKEHAEGFVAFFGGSFTFGEGLNDNETLPYFVSTLLPEYSVYNYGVTAYGTQHLLALIQERPLRKEIDESKGIAIYVYIDDHVRRAAITLRRAFSHKTPYYVLSEKGEVERRGNFHSTRPVLYSLYRDVLLRSNVLNFFHFDFPKIGDEQILLTCRLIVDARHRFRDQIEESDLYVLFYPGHHRYGPDVRDCLEVNGVPYFDYSNEAWPEEYMIPNDVHPGAPGNRRLAEMIASKLRIDLGRLAQ